MGVFSLAFHFKGKAKCYHGRKAFMSSFHQYLHILEERTAAYMV